MLGQAQKWVVGPKQTHAGAVQHGTRSVVERQNSTAPLIVPSVTPNMPEHMPSRPAIGTATAW